jgi:multidrug efflux pump subunit AcrA (membrane-fusion protein)
MSNALQGNLSALDKAQANALASLDLQLTNLTTQYRNDLAKAFAEGNLAKVATLYENYESNKAALLSQAQFDAQLQLSRDQLAQQQSQFDASLAEQIRQFDETMTFNQDKYAASQTSGSGTRLVTSPEPIITDDPKYVFTGVRSTTDPGVVDDVYQEALYRRGFKGANDVELIDFLASMVVAGRILYEEAQAIMKRLGIAG